MMVDNRFLSHMTAHQGHRDSTDERDIRVIRWKVFSREHIDWRYFKCPLRLIEKIFDKFLPLCHFVTLTLISAELLNINLILYNRLIILINYISIIKVVFILLTLNFNNVNVYMCIMKSLCLINLPRLSKCDYLC